MLTLTTRVITTTGTGDRDRSYWTGLEDGYHGIRDTTAAPIIPTVRSSVGFAERMADLLTPPDANAKLDKSAVPTYGLTLAHSDMSGYRACPWIGDCERVCVLNNGNGRYASVQMAWLWRTRFLADHPLEAIYRIGWELGRAIAKYDAIMFRPNVNSDLLWHRIIPLLGRTERITTYGYTKNPAVLSSGNGWVGGIRYAYSHNERTNTDRVRRFVEDGGAVAVVTNRSPKAPVIPDLVRAMLGVSADVADADATDAWMIADGVIGDLSAKGKARDLAGRSGFVVLAY